jgi:cysteine desulfurase
MGARAYLDHNATTPLRPAAAEAMLHALQSGLGNPSSVHAEGRAARAALDTARKQIARALGGEARNVVLTSGATEALNTLLRPSPAVVIGSGARRTERLLVLATEHSAALTGGGFESDRIETIPVDQHGQADLGWLEARLAACADATGHAPVTVALQLANSETGVVQPVAAASALTRRFGALLVCDGVAAVGKIPVDLEQLQADAIVISGHKFGGPMGAGAIVLRGERLHIVEPLLKGGGQEMRRRSGTENVPAIIGMGAALADAVADLDTSATRIDGQCARLLQAFRAMRPDLVVFGDKAPRLPNTLNIAVPGLTAETALIAFDLAGVAVSSGSACSSGKVKRSHVLAAMGVSSALAEAALRFSLGWTTTEQDIDLAIAAFAKVANIKMADVVSSRQAAA